MSPQPDTSPQNFWHLTPAAGQASPELHREYVSTRAMGLRAERELLRHAPQDFAINVLIFSFGPLFFLLPGALQQKQPSSHLLLAGLSCVGIAFLLCALLYVVLFLTRYPRADTLRPLSYSLRPDGIHGRNPQGRTFKPWSSVRSVYRRGDDIFIQYQITQKSYIPVEAFADEASAERFMEAVRQLAKARGDFNGLSPDLWQEFGAR